MNLRIVKAVAVNLGIRHRILEAMVALDTNNPQAVVRETILKMIDEGTLHWDGQHVKRGPHPEGEADAKTFILSLADREMLCLEAMLDAIDYRRCKDGRRVLGEMFESGELDYTPCNGYKRMIRRGRH